MSVRGIYFVTSELQQTSPDANRLAHIDGLRAVAILSVLAFDMHVPGFRGGFAGVDIFFVISGFLICGQIMDELNRGRFSFARFYARRVLRILPPMLLVVGVVLAVARALPMLPAETQRIGNSAAASAAMVANWYFMQQEPYFDVGETEPFLHLWSLGVEEQFYLLAPLALALASMAALRYRKPPPTAWLAITLAGLAVSLALALLFTRSKPQFGYYATPVRMWELSAGGLTACLVRRGLPWPASTMRSVAGLGLAMIVAGVAWTAPDAPYRAARLLLPVGGTALVLAAGAGYRGGAVRLLAVAPLPAIGLISYGWYLWHRPLAELWQLTRIDPLSWNERAIAVLAVPLVLAVATYYGVERPLRAWRHRAHQTLDHRRLVAWGLAASALLAVAGLTLSAWGSSVARQSTLRAFDDAVRPAWQTCESAARGAELARCRIGPGPMVRAVVWGDSHAAALYTAVQTAATYAGSAAVLRWSAGCPALSTPLLLQGQPWTECMEDNARVLDWLRSPEAADVSAVVVATRWRNYGGTYLTAGADAVSGPRPLHQAVSDTLERLTRLGLRVLVVGPVPEFLAPPPQCLFRAWQYSFDPLRCGVFREHAEIHQEHVPHQLIAATAPYSSVRLLLPVAAFCDATWCRADRTGDILFTDNHHLSNAGGRALYDTFRASFDWVFQ